MEDRDSIQERMLNNIDERFDKTKGSFFYDATKPAAIEIEKKGYEIKAVESKLDVENLHGGELERYIISRTGVIRKNATKATTLVTILGQEGAIIKKGDLVAADTINYLSLENMAITDGSMNVLVECELYGSVGNVPVGAVNRFPVTLQGLTSVTNLDTVTNGYDAESDAELRVRYYQHIRTPATSGNRYHYLNWAKEIVGVGDAKIFSLWAGNNTVKVIIIDSNKLPAGEDLIEEVQEYIDPGISGLGEGQAPIGAFCTVDSAIGKDIDINFKVVTNNLEVIEDSVRENITEYLKSIAFTGAVVSYAKIGAMILDSEGVIDYSNLKVNGGATNISIDEMEVAILGEVVISE